MENINLKTFSQINIALVNPQIPQNTGNIGRLAAGVNAKLIIAGKPKFSLDDKYLKRAGLDYWKYINLELIEDLEKFFFLYSVDKYYYALITKFGQKRYDEIYKDVVSNKNEVLFLFGNETEGLSSVIHNKFYNQRYYIPMNQNHVRSINLANSVAIVIYSFLKELDFKFWS